MHHSAAQEETPAQPEGIIHADYFDQPHGYFARRRFGTQDWLVTFTLAGEGHYFTNPNNAEHCLTCSAGDVVVLAPGAFHHYGTARPDAHWQFYWAHFLPRLHWLSWLHLPEVAPKTFCFRVTDVAASERIQLAFGRLLQHTRQYVIHPHQIALAHALANNALEEMLLLIAQQSPGNPSSQTQPPPPDPRIYDALRKVQENFTQRLTVAGIAKQVGLSPSRLAHLFKQYTGTSLIEMVLRLRMKQAASLLELTTLSVTQIAEQTGFESAFYFSRQFKARHGVSPKTFREQIIFNAP